MANTNILEEKKSIVSEISDKVKDSSSVIFFEYRGLSVAELTELRRKLREIGSDFKIYKNTLTRRALKDLNLDVEESLMGPNAIAFSTKVVEPIKALTDFAKAHNALEIKGGIVDGAMSSVEIIKKLATIPSREALLTMVAGGMIGVVKNLSACLHLYAEQKENN